MGWGFIALKWVQRGKAGVVTKAAILCGGVGTRLKPLTDYFQKTMIPIGPRRRPLLEYVVRLLVNNGVHDIVMLCGYRAEEIENYFGDGQRFGANIGYSLDPKDGKGSAVALLHAIDNGKIGKFDDLVVYYGDVLSSLDIRALLIKMRQAEAAVAIAVSKDYNVPVGVVEVKKDQIVRLREKPNLNLGVTTGALAISKKTVTVLRESVRTGGTDIMSHFVPRVIEKGMKVVPFYQKGFWYDVGTTEAYERLDPMRLQADLGFLG